MGRSLDPERHTAVPPPMQALDVEAVPAIEVGEG